MLRDGWRFAAPSHPAWVPVRRADEFASWANRRFPGRLSQKSQPPDSRPAWVLHPRSLRLSHLWHGDAVELLAGGAEPCRAVLRGGAAWRGNLFIISGYLITGSLIRHQSAAKFLIDRAIRLYPVFMTIQLIVFGLGPAVHYKWLSGISAAGWLIAFVENGLFLPGIFDLPLAQLNAWSLSYEAAFYLVGATCFILARRLGQRPVIAALVVFLAFVIPLDPRAAFFLPGVAIFFLSRRTVPNLPVWLRALSPPALVATLALLTAAETVRGAAYAALIPALIFFVCVRRGEMPAVSDLADPLPAISGHDQLQFLSVVAGRDLSDEDRDRTIPAWPSARLGECRAVRDRRIRGVRRGRAAELSDIGRRRRRRLHRWAGSPRPANV